MGGIEYYRLIQLARDSRTSRIVLKGRLMDCSDFIENYSDFLDRRFEAHSIQAYRDHVTRCPSCTRYNRVVQNGLCLIRDLEPASIQSDFEPRLQTRFYDFQANLARQEKRLFRAASVATISAVALLVVVSIPTLTAGDRPVRLPPLVVDQQALTLTASASFFDFAPSIAPVRTSLFPDYPDDQWLTPRPRRLSLFRAPLKVASARTLSDPEPKPEEASAE